MLGKIEIDDIEEQISEQEDREKSKLNKRNF